MIDKFILSEHAKLRIKNRGISMKEVEDVLQTPDKILYPDDEKCIFQSVKEYHEGNHLIRIFVNIAKEPPVVITAYKTSKIEKYL